jgi:hypothetical protein
MPSGPTGPHIQSVVAFEKGGKSLTATLRR